MTLIFMVRVIENPSLVTRSMCECEPEREEEENNHSETAAYLKLRGGENDMV